jgi:hypothetical protein
VELIGGGIWIEPIVTERAVEGYSESMQPILRREPLHQAENKYRVGLPIQYLFRPIPCGIGAPRRKLRAARRGSQPVAKGIRVESLADPTRGRAASRCPSDSLSASDPA